MSTIVIKVQVRFCPDGKPTFDEEREFERIPNRGESIIRGDEVERFVVVDIDWQEDGTPFLVAHESSRPRARRALGYD